jgi:hypothetical protein
VHQEATMDDRDEGPDEEVEAYGLRVGQSEAVRLEAAEFLVATRAQQETRLRIAKGLDELRHLGPSGD